MVWLDNQESGYFLVINLYCSLKSVGEKNSASPQMV